MTQTFTSLGIIISWKCAILFFSGLMLAVFMFKLNVFDPRVNLNFRGFVRGTLPHKSTLAETNLLS